MRRFPAWSIQADTLKQFVGLYTQLAVWRKLKHGQIMAINEPVYYDKMYVAKCIPPSSFKRS